MGIFCQVLSTSERETSGLATEIIRCVDFAFSGGGSPSLTVLAVDRAGWNGIKMLKVLANVTLVLLPPYNPELNLVERVWLYLRERFLSLRVFKDYSAILDACCERPRASVSDGPSPNRAR